MENIVIEMAVEVIVGIIIPIITAGVFVVRYFWRKEKRDALYHQKIDYLCKKEYTSHDTHNTLYEKINDLENRITALESKMKLLLNHFGINFKK